MSDGISIREFARRDGCSEGLVRRAVGSGRLAALPDGLIDPRLVGSGWRKANRRKASEEIAPAAPDLQRIADRAVRVDGHAPYTLAEAERVKENYLALLRQLQYDRESGAVVLVDQVAAAIAGEYSIVRNRLLSLPAKIAPRLAVLRKTEETKALLEVEITNILEELTADEPSGRSKVRRRRAKPKPGTSRRKAG
jgi:hypothetical protein